MKHTDTGEQYGVEVAQTSPYSHGLWNIKDNWRLPNIRPVTSHNVAGNTRERQLQMPKETPQNRSVDFSF